MSADRTQDERGRAASADAAPFEARADDTEVVRTAQGPTPEIRRAVRADDAGRTAAAQPALDRRTRADVTAGQDRRDDAPDMERTVVEPDPPRVLVDPPTDPPERRTA